MYFTTAVFFIILTVWASFSYSQTRALSLQLLFLNSWHHSQRSDSLWPSFLIALPHFYEVPLSKSDVVDDRFF